MVTQCCKISLIKAAKLKKLISNYKTGALTREGLSKHKKQQIESYNISN